MTKSSLLLSTALGLSMAFSGTAVCAKNVAGFMSRGPTNAHLPLVRAPVLERKNKASLFLLYERGWTYSASKGVYAISNPSTGVYCITPIKPVKSTSNPQVTLEWSASYGSSFIDFWENQAYDCASGDVEVKTYDASGKLTDDSAFFLIIDS